MSDSKFPNTNTRLSRRSLLKAGLLGVLATGCTQTQTLATPTTTSVLPTNLPTVTLESPPTAKPTQTVTPSAIPTNVPDVPIRLNNPIIDIASASAHGLILLDNGQVYGWGNLRALGIDNENNDLQPYPLPLVNWDSISKVYAHRSHSIYITQEKMLYVDGFFDFEVEAFSDAEQVSTNERADVLMVVRTDGTLWGIGEAERGQLGNDDTTFQPEFVRVPLDNIMQVECLGNLVCALRDDGSVWYWGNNASVTDTQGIDDPTLIYPVPQRLGSVENIQQIARGDGLIMLQSDGSVKVWVGGNITSVSNLPIMTQLAGDFPFYSGGISEDGGLWVWGRLWFTALSKEGDVEDWFGTEAEGIDRFTARQLELRNVVQVSFEDVNLVLDKDGTVWAWGSNSDGQVGNGDVSNRVFEPTPIIYSG